MIQEPFDLPNDELLHELLRIGVTKTFQKGEIIFSEGEKAEFLPIVLTGSVKVVRQFDAGKEVILNIFEDGEIFAIPPSLDGKLYPATAISMKKSRLLLVASSEARKLINNSEKFSRFAIENMARLLRETTDSLLNIASNSPERRIGNILVRLMKKDEGELPIKIELRRQDIAEMAGLTTETTIRAVKRLEDRNLLRIKKGKIFIDNPDFLRENFGCN